MEAPDKKDITLEVTARTDTGMQREANEDNFIVTNDCKSPEWILPKGEYANSGGGSILVVADGMGGLNAGEVASHIAVESVKSFFSSADTKSYKDEKQALSDAIIKANSDIVAHGKAYPESAGMGSTIVMALIKGQTLHVAWVGDSRLYLWRNGDLVQLSKDHSYVQGLVDQGKITREQAFIHPESNIITQSLGDEERKPKPGYVNFSLADKDIVLLCSDGLNGMLQDDEIARIVTETPDLSQAAEKLIEAANREGGLDNITVLMAKVINGAGAVTPAAQPLNKTTITGGGSAKKKPANKIWIALIAVIIVAVSVFAVKHFMTPGKATPVNAVPQGADPGNGKPAGVQPADKNDKKPAETNGTLHGKPKGTIDAGNKPQNKKNNTADSLGTATPPKGTKPAVKGSGLTKIDSLKKVLKSNPDSTIKN